MLKICSLLLSLVFTLFTVLRPYLKIYKDTLLSYNKGNISFLLCLDLSSAFDTVDHSSLIQQLETSIGTSGSCLKWIFSYLSNRNFVVSINDSYSTPSSFSFGVSQGSVFGPLLFILYSSELPRIISLFSLQLQLYADDSHIFTSFPNLNYLLLSLKSFLLLVI